MTRMLARFGRFNAVGVLSVTVKLGVLTALVEWAGAGYLVATALSVEAAILHGFFWHQFWTWGDRRDRLAGHQLVFRLVRYNAANGVLAVAVNLGLMGVLVGGFGLHYLPAAMIATVTAGLVNFLISDRFVFVRERRAGQAA